MPNENNANESVEAENDTDIDEQESVNTADEDTSINESESSDEGTDETGESDESESNDEADNNPYEARLKELEKENEEIKRNKTEAIRAERKKRQVAEAKVKQQEDGDLSEDEKPLTRKELEVFYQQKEDVKRIESLATNESERNLISKFVEQGYSVDDAYLKANSHIIEEHKQAEREQEQTEATMAGYSRAVSRGKKGSPAWSTDPIKKQAADGMSPEERKYLDKI